jgi:hypothetical protein
VIHPPAFPATATFCGPSPAAPAIGVPCHLHVCLLWLQVFVGDYFGPANVPLPVVATGRQTGVAGGDVVRTSVCSIVGAGHTTLHCVSPPGVGAGYSWSLSVAGRSSPLSAQTTSYGPPSLTAVAVSGAGIAGGDEAGTVPAAGGATVTVTGANFGSDTADIVLTWDGAVMPVVFLTQPHTAVSFASLPGQGLGANVTLSVGGQPATSVVRVPFAAPRVTSLRLAPTIGSEVPLDCGDVGADGRPVGRTNGTAVLVIRGANFGRGNATVATIRGVPCVLRAPVDDLEIVCQTELCTGAMDDSVAVAELGLVPEPGSPR